MGTGVTAKWEEIRSLPGAVSGVVMMAVPGAIEE